MADYHVNQGKHTVYPQSELDFPSLVTFTFLHTQKTKYKSNRLNADSCKIL